MAQFFRVCKSEICCVVRSYGTQRYQQNHYETLNISPDASQKDIRRAFIRLSKQLHPDTSGKHSHADFVKLNEAYSILGKENTRRQYDLELKYNRSHPFYVYNSQNIRYGSQWEYEVRAAGGPWPPPPPDQKPDASFGLKIALLFCSLGLVQAIFLFYSMKMRKIAILRNAQLEHQYRHTRDMAHIKSHNHFAIKDFDSAEDLNKYLATDNSEC